MQRKIIKLDGQIQMVHVENKTLDITKVKFIDILKVESAPHIEGAFQFSLGIYIL